MHFVNRRLLIVIAAFAALFIMALPAFAAPGGYLTGATLDAANCTFYLSATVEDAGFYAINMWDDGNFRAGAGGDIGAGQTFTVAFTIGGPILQGAAGIGVYLEDAVGFAAVTTYDSNGSGQFWDDQTGTDCQNAGFTFGATFLGVVTDVVDACNGAPYPRPAGSVIYNVPAGALAYWDDDLNTYTGFNLPPGTWYISEFTDSGFARVWISCQASPVYIPVENVVR